MFQRELLIIASFLAALVLVVAGAGWYAIWELHQTSRMLVNDTVPGLADAGLAGERMNDNRNRMRELLAPHTPAERDQIIAQIKANSTEALWQDYANSIFENADQKNYQAMMLVRSQYLACCEEFYQLLTAEKIAAATTLFNGELAQRFQTYNAAAKKLFDYNVQQGLVRGNAVIRATSLAPWLISGFCVLVFIAGLALGLRSGLSGGGK